MPDLYPDLKMPIFKLSDIFRLSNCGEKVHHKNGQLTITGPFGELRCYSIGRHATTTEKKQKFSVRTMPIVICHFKVMKSSQ